MRANLLNYLVVFQVIFISFLASSKMLSRGFEEVKTFLIPFQPLAIYSVCRRFDKNLS
jgi:hypothetical protein